MSGLESKGSPRSTPIRVVYLLGAGATQACVEKAGRPYGVLMDHLATMLPTRLRELVTCKYTEDRSLVHLANSVIDETTDFEQLITFLSDSPSMVHRDFAEDLPGPHLSYCNCGNGPDEMSGRYWIKCWPPIGPYEPLMATCTNAGVPELVDFAEQWIRSGVLTTNYGSCMRRSSEAHTTRHERDVRSHPRMRPGLAARRTHRAVTSSCNGLDWQASPSPGDV